MPLVAWSVASVSFGDLTPGWSLPMMVTVLAPLTLAPGGLSSLSACRRDSVHFKVPLGGGQDKCPDPIAGVSGSFPESSVTPATLSLQAK